MRLLFFALVACGGPPPLAPIVEGPIDPSIDAAPEIDQSCWIPGEELRYDLRFRGVVLAEMNMAVGEPGVIAGREVVVVRSRAATAGVVGLAGVRASEDATSWIEEGPAASSSATPASTTTATFDRFGCASRPASPPSSGSPPTAPRRPAGIKPPRPMRSSMTIRASSACSAAGARRAGPPPATGRSPIGSSTATSPATRAPR